jgi:uncharacterized membrane protein YhaH (DUF805 family)
MFKSKKQEYWFWMVLFFINMLTFFVFMQGDDSKIQALFSIVMMFFCFGKSMMLADKIDEK